MGQGFARREARTMAISRRRRIASFAAIQDEKITVLVLQSAIAKRSIANHRSVPQRQSPPLVVESSISLSIAPPYAGVRQIGRHYRENHWPQRPPRRPLRSPASRSQVVRALGKQSSDLRRRGSRLDKEEVLRTRNAALSLRRTSHGTRAQLCHRRRPGPLYVDEGPPRAPSHGLGLVRFASGKCGHSEQHSAAPVDPRQHCQDEGADESPRLCLPLVPRSHHLPARLLPLEPVVLSQVLRKRLGLPQE